MKHLPTNNVYLSCSECGHDSRTIDPKYYEKNSIDLFEKEDGNYAPVCPKCGKEARLRTNDQDVVDKLLGINGSKRALLVPDNVVIVEDEDMTTEAQVLALETYGDDGVSACAIMRITQPKGCRTYMLVLACKTKNVVAVLGNSSKNAAAKARAIIRKKSG